MGIYQRVGISGCAKADIGEILYNSWEWGMKSMELSFIMVYRTL